MQRMPSKRRTARQDFRGAVARCRRSRDDISVRRVRLLARTAWFLGTRRFHAARIRAPDRFALAVVCARPLLPGAGIDLPAARIRLALVVAGVVRQQLLRACIRRHAASCRHQSCLVPRGAAERARTRSRCVVHPDFRAASGSAWHGALVVRPVRSAGRVVHLHRAARGIRLCGATAVFVSARRVDGDAGGIAVEGNCCGAHCRGGAGLGALGVEGQHGSRERLLRACRTRGSRNLVLPLALGSARYGFERPRR